MEKMKSISEYDLTESGWELVRTYEPEYEDGWSVFVYEQKFSETVVKFVLGDNLSMAEFMDLKADESFIFNYVETMDELNTLVKCAKGNGNE